MTQARSIFTLAGAAICTGLLAMAVAPSGAKAETHTQCTGARCVGSDCTWDGDAHNCWQESVTYREPGEHIRWVCDRWDESCKWVRLPGTARARHSIDYGSY